MHEDSPRIQFNINITVTNTTEDRVPSRDEKMILCSRRTAMALRKSFAKAKAASRA